MLASEFFSLLVFIGTIGYIYIREFTLLKNYLAQRLRRQPTKEFFSKTSLFIHALSFLGIMCFAYAYFVEPYKLTVTSIDIASEKLSLSSFRVVHISDLHCDARARNEAKLISLVNALRPDIIVFTGDAINSPAALPLFKDTLSGLKAQLAKFAVSGNIDSWYPELDYYTGTGFRQLQDECVSLVKDGQRLMVCGMSDESQTETRLVAKDITQGCYAIMLCHRPDRIEEAAGLSIDTPTSPISRPTGQETIWQPVSTLAEPRPLGRGNRGVDLYLAGHTHAGQVALPWYGAIVTLSRQGKKYEAGAYTVGNTLLYVNRGIGMEGGPVPRVRFFSRPEVGVLDIHPAATAAATAVPSRSPVLE